MLERNALKLRYIRARRGSPRTMVISQQRPCLTFNCRVSAERRIIFPPPKFPRRIFNGGTLSLLNRRLYRSLILRVRAASRTILLLRNDFRERFGDRLLLSSLRFTVVQPFYLCLRSIQALSRDFVTSLIKSAFARLLFRRLESATRSLKISAPQRVVIESWASEISASCLTDLKLQSVHGAIKFDAKSVYMNGLKTATPVQGHSSREQQQQQQQQYSARSSSAHQVPRETTIYQLCVCATGKLFLARPDGSCQADKSIC